MTDALVRPPEPRRAAPPRILALALVAILVAVIVIAVTRGPDAVPVTPVHVPGEIRVDPNVGPFRGLGVWVDIYDEPSWNDPVGSAQLMAEHGVRTLYLQTSNDHRPGPFVHEAGTAAMLEAAHDHDIQVIAWYLPGFVDPEEDLARSIAAIDLRTPRGDRFDGFALDIESPDQKDAAERTRNLLALSSALRERAGETYPLGAIIPLPDWLEEDPGYWPGFPYADLAMTYDAILPMTYFTWRVSGPEAVATFTERNVAVIRQQVDNPAVPIHVIGGLARDSTAPEMRAFVGAVRRGGVLGASVYSLPMVTAEQWASLERVPARSSPG